MAPSRMPIIICHLDLDCFYAQVEARRLALSTCPLSGPPLAVQQWSGLIAVNYPARRAGVTRFMNATVAAQTCPSLRLVHVQTISTHKSESDSGERRIEEDDTIPAQNNNHGAQGAPLNSSTSRDSLKVSLERYRDASRLVVNAITEALDEHKDAILIQKASIDEVYIDLTSVVAKLTTTWTPNEESRTANSLSLPRAASFEEAVAAAWREAAPTACVGWDGDGTPPKVAQPYVIGSFIMHRVRSHIWNTLSYTCSAGVAKNKLVSKLASARNKPNKQTCILPDSHQDMVADIELSSINGFGGKAGKAVLAALAPATTPRQIRQTFTDANGSLEDGLRRVLHSRERAAWVANVVSGENDDPVTPNLRVKSINACKSGTFSNAREAREWLNLLSNEVASRLAEETERRGRAAGRAKTLTLHFRGKLNTDHRDNWVAGNLASLTPERSRSAPLALGPGGSYPPNGDSIATQAWRLFTSDAGEPIVQFPVTRLQLAVSLPDETTEEKGAQDISALFGKHQQKSGDVSSSAFPAAAAAAAAAATTSLEQQPAAVSSAARSAPWSCLACTLENAASSSRCEACGALKGSSLPPTSTLALEKKRRAPTLLDGFAKKRSG